MFKNTFITLTVSLLILGLLSVIQPQTQEIESTNEKTYATENTEIETLHSGLQEYFVNDLDSEFIRDVKEVKVEEPKEKSEEVQPAEKVEQPKTVVKEQPKQVAKVVVKEQPKEEVKTEAKEEVKADVSEEPKEEVKSE